MYSRILSAFTSVVLCLLTFISSAKTVADDPGDSVYLFAYSKDQGRSGLLLAWSHDQQNWNGIGPHHRFLFSDFGPWGSQKRMFDPYLFQDQSGLWHCVWTLNDGVKQLAHASSENLIDWAPQVYPQVSLLGNIDRLEAKKSTGGAYQITWASEVNGIDKVYLTSTSDFKTYTPAKSVGEDVRMNDRFSASIAGEEYRGMVNKVSWNLVQELIKHYEWSVFHEQERGENLKDDAVRFAGLETVKLDMKPQTNNTKAISDKLIGIFFEDISYAADGGIYAELIQNRDFEYHPMDQKNRNKEWNNYFAWSWEGEKYGFTIDSVAPIHENNPHFAVVEGMPKTRGLVNEGWSGINLTAGEKYDFSVFGKSLDAAGKSVKVKLTRKDGTGNLGEATIKKIGTVWKQYTVTISATETVADAQLEIVPLNDGKLALDMISLFPQKTFNDRKNGLRNDLAQVVADLQPKFVRFPGGCASHGDGLDNIYKWKYSIGPLEARVPMRNIWNYHQTLGLGFYEYFQFCEDIGAAPLPVLAAGVPCQNSGTGGFGQCGGIPMDEMDEYVQDILDLIEWANGDKYSTWGKKRADAGHPKPFNLKYLGIGNEDLITDIFEERFTMIYEAVKERYPEIVVIGTVGPFYYGSDYEYGWKLARKLNLPMVDEHYYQPPGWFINNQDYYDKYDRNASKVYLGEYASHVPGRKLNMESALSEALYLTAIERNADIVEMTSYAPLLAKEHHTNWNPDLIYFNNSEVKLTTGYYVQKLFSEHAGNTYVYSDLKFSDNNQEVLERVGVSVVKDEKSGDYIVKLVNLLPVAVETKIDLSELGIPAQKANLIMMKGDPQDEKTVPASYELEVSPSMEYAMQPYSFSVLRVKQHVK